MNTPFSLVIGMVYTYLPFMILPLYGNLAKMDLRLLEAAADLGATPWVAFWKITVPLSKAGIIAGSMLVFIPCIGEYVIPELLGGPQTLMIGRVLWDEFFSNNDWPMASSRRRRDGAADPRAAGDLQPLPGAGGAAMRLPVECRRLVRQGLAVGLGYLFLYLPIVALVLVFVQRLDRSRTAGAASRSSGTAPCRRTARWSPASG